MYTKVIERDILESLKYIHINVNLMDSELFIYKQIVIIIYIFTYRIGNELFCNHRYSLLYLIAEQKICF